MFLFAILLMQAFMYKDPVADQLIRAGYAGELRPEDRRDARTDAQTPTNVSGSPVGYLLAAESWWESQADPGNREIYALY
jgi:hypothetical protein